MAGFKSLFTNLAAVQRRYSDSDYAEWDDIIAGGTKDDKIYGFNGDDKLWGGAGDDLLNGGNGIDLIDGSSGIDTAEYYFSSKNYGVSKKPGSDNNAEIIFIGLV